MSRFTPESAATFLENADVFYSYDASDPDEDAARAAARDHLKPTTEWLQTSAAELVKRMCEVGRLGKAA